MYKIVLLLSFFCVFHVNAQQKNYEWSIQESFYGPEDITWNTKEEIAYVSCVPRRKSEPSMQGKIMGWKNGKWVQLHDSLKFPFRPHGISFHQDQLYVINHRKKKQTTIEIFEIQNNKLNHSKTLFHKGFTSPNDLVVVGKEDFYFSIDPNGRSLLYMLWTGIFRCNYDKLSHYQNGNVTTLCRMSYPNGIAAKDSMLWISSIYKKRIEVRTTNGKLLYAIPLKTAPDNLEWDSEGNLWVACHPSFGKFLKHVKSSQNFSPTQIYQIKNPASNEFQVIKVLEDEGKLISAASVAAPFKNIVLVGCVFDPKIAVGKQLK